MDSEIARGYRRDIEALIEVQRFQNDSIESCCPFDHLPCKRVNSCDAVLSLNFGFDCVEGHSCPRAVFKAGKK